MRRRLFTAGLAVILGVCMPGSSKVYADLAETATEEVETIVLQENVDSLGVDEELTNVEAVYNEAEGTITLNLGYTAGISYLKISCNSIVLEEHFTGNSYTYTLVGEEKGGIYTFEVEAYDAKGVMIDEEEEECSVPFSKSKVTEISVYYDPETRFLRVEWDGEGVEKADVYFNDVLLGTQLVDRYEGVIEQALLPGDPFACKVVPYNASGEVGIAGLHQDKISDYTAKIIECDVSYDETTKKIDIEWTSTHTSYVDIVINDELAVEGYQGDDYVVNYQLQPGSTYTVTVVPYNKDKAAGVNAERTLLIGSLETPEEPEIEQISEPILNSDGSSTGLYKPACKISFAAQDGAYYEIYRAMEDEKASYTWFTTVRGTSEDILTYIDRTVGYGDYFYKVTQKIVADDYVTQEMSSGMSEPGYFSIYIPKSKLSAAQNSDGSIQLNMSVRSEVASGYVIYRKSGGHDYKAIATVTGNTYTDKNVRFGTKYSYRVRAYYYDKKLGKKVYGRSSKTVAIKNGVGDFEVSVKEISKGKVQLKWTPASNATEYEIYYKTNVTGDSYKYVKTITKTKYEMQLSSNTRYKFMIKACGTNSSKKTYINPVEVAFQTGYSNPEEITVGKSSYVYNGLQKAITQKNTIRWNRVYGADGYELEYLDSNSQTYKSLAVLSSGRTKYTVSNIVEATEKKAVYRLTAFKAGKRLRGEAINITVAFGVPDKVAVKTVSNGFKVSWKPVTAAEKYLVYRSNGRMEELLGETTKLSYTDKNIEIGVSYTYYVKAVSMTLGMEGELSEGATKKKGIGKMSGVSARKATANKNTIRWKKLSKASSYVIYYSKEKDGEYKKLAEVAKNKLRYNHRFYVANTGYYYKVVGVFINRAGASIEAPSKIVSVNTEKK